MGTWRSEDSITLHLLRWDLSLNLKLVFFQLMWWPSSPSDPPVCDLNSVVTCTSDTQPTCYVGSGIWTEVLMVVQQPPPSHPSSLDRLKIQRRSLGCVLIYLNSGIRNHQLRWIPDLKFYFTVARRFHSTLAALAEVLGSVPSTHTVPHYHL